MMWKDMAKALDCNSKRKIMCCGSSPSALISNNRFGIRFHCFRCTDFNTFIPHGKRSVSEILAARKATHSLKALRLWVALRAASISDTLRLPCGIKVLKSVHLKQWNLIPNLLLDIRAEGELPQHIILRLLLQSKALAISFHIILNPYHISLVQIKRTIPFRQLACSTHL